MECAISTKMYKVQKIIDKIIHFFMFFATNFENAVLTPRLIFFLYKLTQYHKYHLNGLGQKKNHHLYFFLFFKITMYINYIYLY